MSGLPLGGGAGDEAFFCFGHGLWAVSYEREF